MSTLCFELGSLKKTSTLMQNPVTGLFPKQADNMIRFRSRAEGI